MSTPAFAPPLLALVALLGLVPACGDRDLHPVFAGRPRPIVFSHRGGGGHEPEETLEALRHAHARHPDFVVEFDVRRSKDRVLVLMHDDEVERTTGKRGKVGDLTLAELKALDAGFCATPGVGDGTAPRGTCTAEAPPDPTRFPLRGKGYVIPTLDEVLAALPADALLGVEVKAPGFEAQVAETLRRSGRLAKLVVGAEDDDVAVRLKDLLPEAAHYLPRAAATCFAIGAKARLDYAGCPAYDVFASPVSEAGLSFDTRRVLDAAHARGVYVIYWTINEAADMERLFRLGADGIFTDYPDRAGEVLRRLRTAGVVK